eukprot:4966817-Pleurochrysis_carterae.AAC.3
MPSNTCLHPRRWPMRFALHARSRRKGAGSAAEKLVLLGGQQILLWPHGPCREICCAHPPFGHLRAQARFERGDAFCGRLVHEDGGLSGA